MLIGNQAWSPAIVTKPECNDQLTAYLSCSGTGVYLDSVTCTRLTFRCHISYCGRERPDRKSEIEIESPATISNTITVDKQNSVDIHVDCSWEEASGGVYAGIPSVCSWSQRANIDSLDFRITEK